jgi:hypothetical protein
VALRPGLFATLAECDDATFLLDAHARMDMEAQTTAYGGTKAARAPARDTSAGSTLLPPVKPRVNS